MNLYSPPSAGEQFTIWLNDHRALISGEIALTRRCRSANEGTGLGHHLTGHLGAVTVDRDVLDAVIEHIGGSVDHVKTVAAMAAERLGRFKLNGQLFGSSPLSRIIELEGLIAATGARTVLWQTTHNVEPIPNALADQIGERLAAANDQNDALRRHLDDATADAFDLARPAGER